MRYDPQTVSITQAHNAALCVVGIALLALAACSREPPAATHTVADYRANAELRRDTVARCANDPGTLGRTPDCINAREATRLEEMRSVRTLPPVELPPTKPARP
jgi:hypothetical protein